MSAQQSDGRNADGDRNDSDPADQRTREELRAQLDVLEEENRRLREEYVRARQTQYRRAALGLGVVGLVALAGAALFSSVRDILLVLGAIGVFAAVLTYYLTPERFISAEVGERIYAMLATNESRLAGELGLTETRVYVPIEASEATAREPARLYVPQRPNYELPSEEDLQSVLVVGEDERTRGLSLAPTGAGLFREFEQALAGPLGDTPSEVTTQVTDALVEDFELVDAAEADTENGRVSIRVTGSAYGEPDRFDHPVESFVAVAVATALAEPVTSETTSGEEAGSFTVTCRWETEASESA